MGTLRDYLHVSDAARMVVGAVDLLDAAPPGSTTVKVIAEGTGRSITEVIAAVEAALGAHLRLAFEETAVSALHTPDIRFRSAVMPELDAPLHVPFADGVAELVTAARRGHDAAR
jgi:UDP-glucose 4-epimerase